MHLCLPADNEVTRASVAPHGSSRDAKTGRGCKTTTGETTHAGGHAEQKYDDAEDVDDGEGSKKESERPTQRATSRIS